MVPNPLCIEFKSLNIALFVQIKSTKNKKMENAVYQV